MHTHCQTVGIHSEFTLEAHIDIAVYTVVLVANYACGIHCDLMLVSCIYGRFFLIRVCCWTNKYRMLPYWRHHKHQAHMRHMT